MRDPIVPGHAYLATQAPAIDISFFVKFVVGRLLLVRSDGHGPVNLYRKLVIPCREERYCSGPDGHAMARLSRCSTSTHLGKYDYTFPWCLSLDQPNAARDRYDWINVYCDVS